jgi:hypothetical protein
VAWNDLPVSVHPLLAGEPEGRFDPAATCRVWLATVHQAARETGGVVTGGVQRPNAGRSHHRIGYRSMDGVRLQLLLRAAAGPVAAADDDSTLVPPFRPVPRGDLFELAGLRVADPAELERPLTAELAQGWFLRDRHDIEYHRPPRVGDVIFNWFD